MNPNSQVLGEATLIGTMVQVIPRTVKPTKLDASHQGVDKPIQHPNITQQNLVGFD